MIECHYSCFLCFGSTFDSCSDCSPNDWRLL